MIVIEGLDATGKTTLAEVIARGLNCNIIHSEGPPKWQGEINQRLMRYASLVDEAKDPVIFDRHPAVSQPIYNMARPGSIERIDPLLLKDFYDRKPTFIFCERQSKHHTHIKKPHDTPEHLAAIASYDAILSQAYRMWALEHAHMIYRIGEDPSLILHSVSSRS